MFLKLQPLLYTAVFLLGLELIVVRHDNVFIIVFFLLAISTYQGRKIGGKWKFSVLPVFFVFSSVALLYLVTIKFEQQVFILLAGAMYYLSLFGAYRLKKYDKDQTAKGMNMAATVSTIFFTYAGAYGIYLNFLIPLYVLMIFYSVVTLLVSYQYFSIIKKKPKKVVWTYSFVLTLAMMEIVWALNFWPFGYLTTGVVALILYYILWDLIQSYFLNILSKRRVVANLIFFSIIISLVLITSKWLPVI